ncbi:hypothetical protein [Parenemella sanctibonifatiensis]|uniref:hypothetical protein n=1 Tax=Parenemella sanctibonifatiensis TaxID=2016505 RepID=UPI0011852F90|nr:hypothetical protein [Parenemella sanctibonifatiensis]
MLTGTTTWGPVGLIDLVAHGQLFGPELTPAKAALALAMVAVGVVLVLITRAANSGTEMEPRIPDAP